MKKKDVREMLRLQQEFVQSSIASDIGFVMKGIVSLKIKGTTTTFKPGMRFKKVKAIPSDILIGLAKIKNADSIRNKQ